jgi:hypothetical protein
MPGVRVTPPCHAGPVNPSSGPSSLRFADAARVLTAAAAGLGLVVPTFRSPPRLSGAVRTIRRYARAGDDAVIAITVRDRAFADVLADMVEGVVVTNRLTGAEAVRVRTALAAALREPGMAAA